MQQNNPSRKLKIIVTGLIAQYPLGGVAWDYFQYVLGLQKLGHDVYYLEDTEQWPFNPKDGGLAKDCEFNVKFLSDLMDRYGLAENWAYCFPHNSQWYGLNNEARVGLIESADLLVNVSGTLANPVKYRQIPILVYIDSDPVFTQIKLARGQKDFQKLVDTHDLHFTFGECFSDQVPETGHNWIPTRQPIVLEEWTHALPHRNTFTTVMNWTSHNDVKFEGKSYGQKDKEFKKYIDLPKKLPDTIALELAVNAGKTRRTPYDLLKYKGWKVVDPDVVCPDFDSYRNYIQTSKGEWSVAKNGYMEGQAGWFSCRTACYLAAGRPAVLQDTGFSKIFNTGTGLFAFRNMEEAIEAIKEVESDYQKHSEASLKIAEEYFDSDKVLTELLNQAFET